MSEKVEQLTLQENVLAVAMLHRVGDATIQYAVHGATRVHHFDSITTDEFGVLAVDYARDPKDSLAYARESLHAITQDSSLSDERKGRRLDRYLDAYFDLTTKLDRAAFPNTKPGEVRKGVPDYIPDGFIDMGGKPAIDPTIRSREQIWVDKRAILSSYKDTLAGIFIHDMSGKDLQERKQAAIVRLASEVYRRMPYNKDFLPRAALGGGLVKLDEMSHGICRHQAMTFQVLAQALGVKSQLVKSELNGGRHANNMLRIDNSWYLIDVTNPEHYIDDAGSKVWSPGIFRIDSPPRSGETKRYDVVAPHSKQKSVYTVHDDMYWRIQHP